MAKRPRSVQVFNLTGIALDDQPLRVQVQVIIRRAILAGNCAPSTRLPSSRNLARDLKVSRHTVELAFDALAAEGFVRRRRGSGTFVAPRVPDREQTPLGRLTNHSPARAAPTISARGAIIAGYAGHKQAVVGMAFRPSTPAVELFPRRAWMRLLSRAVARPGTDSWEYGASNGLPELRRAIAAHVAGSRGVACHPDQIIVTTSAQQAIDLAVRVLLDPGDTAWMEDPGYQPARRILESAGADICAVPVDGDGFDIHAAIARRPRARLAYVTPSHQYPTGALMSLERRLALIDWAQHEHGFIIEDDYDGDLRYAGRPLASLQGLDAAGRVIYVGTFNKMMFPALRLGFLVAPSALVDPFLAAKHLLDGHAHGHTQAALASFIEGGHLATHLRDVLGKYEERRDALLSCLHTLGDELDVGSSDAGLHLTAYLRDGGNDRAIATACARFGVVLDPLSRYYAGPPRSGFVLGFACSDPNRTRAAMSRVARVVRERSV